MRQGADLIEGEGLHVYVVRRALRAHVRDSYDDRPLIRVLTAAPLQPRHPK